MMANYIPKITDLNSYKGMKFAHINCRSIFKKLTEIDVLFREFDILLCSETWLDSRYNNNLVSLSGKTCYRADRNYLGNSNKTGGGVAIYVTNDWANYVTIDHVNTFSDPDLEMISLLINRPNHKKMSISCIYRPPKSNPERSIAKISTTLMNLTSIEREVWIGGDFNWDWNKRNHNHIQSVKRLLTRHNLHQLIKG